ncbi:hypothetical protein LTR66_011952 [Elasticomyces elasticus]|nr:hypothetical protein LTR66_011952 [Elasticomyces elasticus]
MNGVSDTSLCDLPYAARDFRERNVLSGIGDSSIYISGDSFPDMVELHRLESYWQLFHPLLPILHSPSFSFDSAPPLLRSAMIAVGAQYSSEWQDKTDAAALHAQCLKCLQKVRRAGSQQLPYRIADLQAIFLIEAYSIFKSRRPPFHLSEYFGAMYSALAHDDDALTLSINLPTRRQRWPSNASGNMSAVQFQATEKQRLLLACYLLDYQHSSLFGRAPLEQSSELSRTELPFPQTTPIWDATPGDDNRCIIDAWGVQHAIVYETISEAIDGATMMQVPPSHLHDAFQSLIMMAWSCKDDVPAIDVVGYPDPDHLLQTVQDSPSIKVAYHVSMLTRNTPVRDLLAVSGESWVMAEKLTSSDLYIQSQIAVRSWAGQTTGTAYSAYPRMSSSNEVAVNRAVYHALELLRLFSDSNDAMTGLLFDEWSIYLASLVLWARSYATSTNVQSSRRVSVSIPQPSEPRTPHIDQAMGAILLSATHEDSAWMSDKSTGVVLQWTKQRLERVGPPHNCGVTNGALDVLGKLVCRGAEEGWF